MSKKLEEKCLFCKYHRQEKTVDGTRDIHYCDKGTSPLYHGSYLQQEEIIRGCKNFKRNNCVVVDKKVLERKEKLEVENADLKAKNKKLKNILDIINKRNVDILTLMHADTLWDYKIELLKSNIHTDLTETEFNLLKDNLK